MNNKRKISIIVPVYNVELYLEECLNSIISQTYSDYEIICVNDASTDNSNKILQNYRETYCNITVIQHEKNRGLSAARNTGMKAAHGEFVVFVDSDDMLMENALLTLNESVGNEAYDIVYYNMSTLNEGTYAKDNKKLIPKYNEYADNLSGQELFVAFWENKEMKIETWRQMYRKEFLEENELWFYEGLLHEDELFSVNAAIKAKRVKNINKDLYVYRRRDKSIMSTMSELRLDSAVIIASELFCLCKSACLDEEMKKVLIEYIRNKIFAIKKWCAYYPNHKILNIGSGEDQIFYSLILNEFDSTYRYINMSQEQLDMLRLEKKIIVYGIGSVGVEVMKCLQANNIHISKVAVTHKEGNVSKVQGYDVTQIEELQKENKEALVIIAVKNLEKQQDMLSVLAKLGFNKTMIPDFIS